MGGAFREQEGQLALFLGDYIGNLGLGWFDEDHVDGFGGGPPNAIEKRLAEASYSSCYLEPALAAARALGVVEIAGVYALCGHVCDRAPGPIDGHPGSYFLGNFAFDHDAQSADAPRRLRDLLEGVSGGRARVMIDAFEPTALDRFIRRGGWEDGDVRGAPVPFLALRDTSPSRAADYAEELRRDGHEARVEIVSPVPEPRASRIERVVRGAEETVRGDGDSIEGLSLPGGKRVVCAPSAAALLRRALADATLLRELAVKLADYEPGREPEEFPRVGLRVVDVGELQVVVGSRSSRRVVLLAALPSGDDSTSRA